MARIGRTVSLHFGNLESGGSCPRDMGTAVPNWGAPTVGAGVPPGKGEAQGSVAWHSPDLARRGRLASCSSFQTSLFVSAKASLHMCPCWYALGVCVSRAGDQGTHCAGC